MIVLRCCVVVVKDRSEEPQYPENFVRLLQGLIRE
jgi:hypothetical protein